MVNHTPGPWSVNEWPQREARTVTSRIGDVCTVPKWKGDSAQWQEQAAANAKLMASAPCLLAELEYAVEVTAAHLGEDHPRVIGARAAIAKATGETP